MTMNYPPAPLVSIGSITCTETTVTTPVGQAPIGKSEWTVTNMSITVQKTPTWAIVVAVIVACFTCLLGLLFLLVKEDQTQGSINVSVRGPGLMFSEALPVMSPYQVTDIISRVDYARSLAAAAAARGA